MWLAVIKMISQVYYRRNLLIRNRNEVSTLPAEPDLIHSNEIFLLPFKLIFYLQQIFAAWFRRFFIASFFLVNLFRFLVVLSPFRFHSARLDRGAPSLGSLAFQSLIKKFPVDIALSSF